jgi:acetyl esterase/lipase
MAPTTLQCLHISSIAEPNANKYLSFLPWRSTQVFHGLTFLDSQGHLPHCVCLYCSLLALLLIYPSAFYVLWSVLVTALKKRRLTGLRKAALTSSARYINTRSSVAQLQYLSGTSPSVYASWARRHGFPAEIEDLRHDARLYWLGPKRTDKVILYIPGGFHFTSP